MRSRLVLALLLPGENSRGVTRQAAELLPAAVEAHEARVPLLLLSADRPPELRENGAGQAIDQLKLFGGAAKWFFEVAPRDAGSEQLRWMRTLACRAFWTALEGRPGAVHLNFPLREPLIADGELPADTSGREHGGPRVRRPRRARIGVGVRAEAGPDAGSGANPVADASVGAYAGADASMGARAGADAGAGADALAQLVAGASRGVLVAGRDERGTGLAGAASAFAQAASWPLLADPLSGARCGSAAIAHYDALLRVPDFSACLLPDLVIRVGDLPVSKPLRSWLAGLEGARQVALDPEGAWQDPSSVLSDALALEPAGTLARLARHLRESGGHPPGQAARDWLGSWRSADELAAGAIAGALAHRGLSEPAVAIELGVLLPANATLFVASSMPVREIETFWPVRADPPRVLCNRGANGIDGTVSAAFGAAADVHARADGGPVVLLIGDVALAHDIGGLIAARRLQGRLTIVLVNNDGGGIFDFLAVSHIPEREVYERHVATPSGLDFAAAAALYGLAHEHAADAPALRAALERALAREGSSIVEVRTARAQNVELHARVWEAVSLALNPRAAAAEPAA